MRSERKKACKAFSRTELVFLVGGVFLFVFILLTYMAKGRRVSTRVTCANHLKNLGLGARMFATDNEDLLPGLVFVTNQTELDESRLPECYQNFRTILLLLTFCYVPRTLHAEPHNHGRIFFPPISVFSPTLMQMRVVRR